MSPCDEVMTLEVSPNLEVSTGGQIGTDSHEQQRVATSRRISPSGKRRAETGERRGDDGIELSPEQTLGTTLSRRGSRRAESTVARGGSRTEKSRRNFGNECCGWSARSIPVRKASGSGLR